MPTLRGVARTALYTHAGTLSTLADVIRHGARQSLDPADPRARGAIDPDLLPRHTVTDEEVAAVVAILEALDPKQAGARGFGRHSPGARFPDPRAEVRRQGHGRDRADVGAARVSVPQHPPEHGGGLGL